MASMAEMIMDIIRSEQSGLVGSRVGGTVGGLVGNIFGPIGHFAGQDLGSALGNRIELLSKGKDPLEQLLGFFVMDPMIKPLSHILPIDLLMGKKKKK